MKMAEWARSVSICSLLLLPSTFVAVGETCPPLPGKGTYSVPGGTNVYYSTDSSLSTLPAGPDGTTPLSQIQGAVSAWNSANQVSGNNRISSQPGPEILYL